MNILLTFLYFIVWLACTILRVIAPESVARAWCEYQLEGMSSFRYTYRTLAKAAEMREGEAPLPPEGVSGYLEGLAHYLGYKSGDEKLESGFLRLFLRHICAKGHALGALMEMEARLCRYNPWEYGWRDGWTQCVYIDRN
ncbi:TPA: hypothetical protein ACNEZX_004531 [Escherichia coli]|nr:hypothetical protein [Escherichia coli]